MLINSTSKQDCDDRLGIVSITTQVGLQLQQLQLDIQPQ